jgi:hypothetical protein
MPLIVPVCPCTGKSLFILSTQWFFWQPHDSREDIIHLNDFLISLNFFSIIRFKRYSSNSSWHDMLLVNFASARIVTSNKVMSRVSSHEDL